MSYIQLIFVISLNNIIFVREFKSLSQTYKNIFFMWLSQLAASCLLLAAIFYFKVTGALLSLRLLFRSAGSSPPAKFKDRPFKPLSISLCKLKVRYLKHNRILSARAFGVIISDRKKFTDYFTDVKFCGIIYAF